MCFDNDNADYKYPWSVMVSYSGVSVTKGDNVATLSHTTCQRGERFDLIRNICVQYDCVPGYYLRKDFFRMKKERKVKRLTDSLVIFPNKVFFWVITNVALLFIYISY